ncbi:MAG TPA: hypothetical protein VGW75_08620 [Solirubrobacteraceae bacterium]|nr:hypothetical protein [Solirubrobacteraceae bacterium]
MIVGASLADAFASAPRRSECWTRGTTVVATREARIYTAFDGGELWAWGCLRRRGARAVPLDAVSRTNGASDFRLAGTFAGYVGRGGGCARGECTGDEVEVVDLRQRPRRIPGGVETTARSWLGRAFVLTPRAEVVLVRDDPAGAAVVVAHAVTGRVERTLDTGAIDPGSLALSGSRVYWMNAGEPRTALLR